MLPEKLLLFVLGIQISNPYPPILSGNETQCHTIILSDGEVYYEEVFPVKLVYKSA